ncbi:uncharacterized protein LOC113796837 [Dermatophagoides pteronyssinus]|uniref:Protein PFC0760c-like isoform X1 n=1 Tax=Dermatophagoides pteronyssinus TaxID=6956 RepID=A0A6P6YCB4_DERPT|nr:protein PFC0760c-like isoform X1 [Dermatophagoides pteronyssinus]
MENSDSTKDDEKKIVATTTNNNNNANNKPIPKMMKMLSENKLKRLNILTFINEKKEILFTKKAYKFEKEHIWREIFEMMRDSGMVSAEKDWRYVRDVSFSNWRKRAQKRLKHLAANGYRLNMDECEFLISDILGQTPDKSMLKKIQQQQNAFKQQPLPSSQQIKTMIKCSNNNIDGDDIDCIDDDDDDIEHDEDEEDEMMESDDEYMIDSDEEDSEFIMNEMFLIPKVVINDNDHSNIKSNSSSSSMIKNGKNQSQIVNHHHRNHNHQGNQGSMVNGSKLSSTTTSKSIHINNINDDHQYYQNEQRLMDLEIENKILKNRYMKLKILKLEKNLGFDHCDEVKDLLINSNHQ